MQGWAWCTGAVPGAQVSSHLSPPQTNHQHPPAPTQSWAAPGDNPLAAQGRRKGITPGQGRGRGSWAVPGHSTTPEQSRARTSCSAASSAMPTGSRSPCPRATAAQRPQGASDCQGPTRPLTSYPSDPSQCLVQTHSIPMPWHSTQCWLLVRGSSVPAFSSKHPKALN